MLRMRKESIVNVVSRSNGMTKRSVRNRLSAISSGKLRPCDLQFAGDYVPMSSARGVTFVAAVDSVRRWYIIPLTDLYPVGSLYSDMV